MEMYTLFINARRETSSERETTETTRNSREGLFSPRDDGISRFTGGREGAGEWAHRAHKTQSGCPRRERCRQKRFGFDENLRGVGKQLETTRREKLFLHTMNEIGSGAFAFTAALMVSSTLLERLCVSMYSWMDIVVDVLCVKK